MQTNEQTLNSYRSIPRITVIGLGGGGCNTINRLSSLRLPGIHLVAANTDALALNACSADKRILLGKSLTRGLGSGGDPEVGRQAAEESFRELIGAINGSGYPLPDSGHGRRDRVGRDPDCSQDRQIAGRFNNCNSHHPLFF